MIGGHSGPTDLETDGSGEGEMAVEIKYPMLQGPNDGYDENDRWMGMTPEEVAVWLEEAREDSRRLHQKWFLMDWKPDPRDPTQ